MFQYEEEDGQALVVDSEPPQKALVPLKKPDRKQVVPSMPEGTYEVDRLIAFAPEEDKAFLRTWLHGKSAGTQSNYREAMQRFFGLVGKPLREVALADVQAFADSLAESDLNPSTQGRLLIAVKSVFSFGYKLGYLPFNVGALVKPPKLEDKLAERIMSEQAMARMLALETHPRNHAILATLYHTGMRVAELCRLQWRNIVERVEGAQITVFGKGGNTRFVYIDQETWLELASLKPLDATPDSYVFCSRKAYQRGRMTHRRMHTYAIRLIVSKAAKRAGVPGNVSPHWFRHAHATHALENGAPLSLVKETLGHSSLVPTSRYVHARPNASSGEYLKKTESGFVNMYIQPDGHFHAS